MLILYIAQRIPYPPNKGEKIRSFNEISYLSRKYDIHLACLADNFEDLKYIEYLKKYCKEVYVVYINPKLAKLRALFSLFTKKPLSVSYYYSKRIQRIIDNLLSTNNYDIIFCYSCHMGEYIFRAEAFTGWLRNHKNKTLVTHGRQKTINQSNKLIMDFVDIDSDKWLQYSKYTKFPNSWLYYIEAKRLAKHELKIAETFDRSIFISNKEIELFQKKNPHIENIVAISNGVDLDYFNPYSGDDLCHKVDRRKCLRTESINNQRTILLFTGTMDYFANIDGIKWFIKDIFPLIKKLLKNVEFFIVGRNPTKEIRDFGINEGIVVTGFVGDIREYLLIATMFVAPLRIARGLQNKVLEAMAMRVPVVATSCAFEGIEGEPTKHLLVEDTPEGFANQVVKLVKDQNMREYLKNNARKLIENKYSWDKNLKVLDDIISYSAIH